MAETRQTFNPRSHSLHARLEAAGLLDGILARLEAGEAATAIAAFLGTKGIETSSASIYQFRHRFLHEWQERKVMEDALKEGIHEKTLPETVRAILLAKIGRHAVAASTFDMVRQVNTTFSEWIRASVADRGEDRQERDSIRKFCLRIEDLLADESKLAALRKAQTTSSPPPTGLARHTC